jgi:hypothetical protein
MRCMFCQTDSGHSVSVEHIIGLLLVSLTPTQAHASTLVMSVS